MTVPHPSHLVENFTVNLRKVLTHAAHMAAARGKKRIEPTDLFYGLSHSLPSHNAQTPSSANDHGKRKKTRVLFLSQESRHIITHAAGLADSFHHPFIGTEHLFLSLLESEDREMQDLFHDECIDSEKIKHQLVTILQTSSNVFDMIDNLFPAHITPSQHERPQDQRQAVKTKKVTALEYFTIDLTDPNTVGRLHPVIGRTMEIDRLTRVLARKTKNNPVLLGFPGVGKTAIVEGLAKRIASGDVPLFLKDKKIHSLSLTTLVAGSAWRGELEMRLKQLLDEIAADSRVILFIDEIHNLVGAGGGNGGALDAGNMLKPALARGEIRCIGATTFPEYKKHIEDDLALERRFQPIAVHEPTPLQTKEMILGILPSYEEYHNVAIPHTTVQAAVDLSVRYLTEHCLPDKALDLLDEAAAHVRLSSQKETPPALNDIRLKIEHLLKDVSPNISSPQQEVAGELKSLFLELKNHLSQERQETRGTVTEDHIASVLSSITGIPLAVLLTSEREKLLRLEEHLSLSIVGQEEAKQTVSRGLRRAKAGLSMKGKPLASFLFLGPSGTGKTELARVLAKELFGNEHLIKLDMSEFSESFSLSRLIGSPSGYIGYKEGGRLTEAVRRTPHSLILFDEIEKAHPHVAHLLLQILEDGTLTDAAGKRVDFSNTVMILTSNIGTEKLQKQSRFGFASHGTESSRMADDVRKELHDILTPELVNRLGSVVFFHPLLPEHIEKIIDLHLTRLTLRMAERNVSLSLMKSARKELSRLCLNTTAGARHVRACIEQHIEHALAEKLLSSWDTAPRALRVLFRQGQFICES